MNNYWPSRGYLQLFYVLILFTSTFLILPSVNAQDDDKAKSENPLLAESQPEFPGGQGELLRYLGTNINYPSEDQLAGIEGTVVSRFVVNEDGSISDVEIVRSVSPTIDAEVIRVVESMPMWKPGEQDGVPVKVYFTMPVRFKWLPPDIKKKKKKKL